MYRRDSRSTCSGTAGGANGLIQSAVETDTARIRPWMMTQQSLFLPFQNANAARTGCGERKRQ